MTIIRINLNFILKKSVTFMPELANDGLFVHLKIAPRKHWYNSFYASNRLLSVSNSIPFYLEQW